MEICPNDKCSGCYACISVCVHNCILMQEDKYGELHPVIDETNCVHCGLCQRVCPNNTDPGFQYPISCKASWITDVEKRNKCASGGIGTIMSEYVVKKGGIVYGTAYDETFTPRTISTNTIEGVECFKGSKYVQSVVGPNTFKDIREKLQSGKRVLYIGTPCQIAGLKNYLRKDYDNLLTVDLICHGVSPTKWFREEVSYISKKIGISDLADVRFRGNDGKNYCLAFWQGKKQDNSLNCVYVKPRYEQPYFAGFLLGVSLRENCYTCNYARPERVGDLTIGDFLRLGTQKKFPYKVKQSSVVLINNDKAEVFYREMCELLQDEIISVDREYAERLVYKPSLLEPFAKHPLHDEFREKILKYGFVKAIRSTLRLTILRYKYMRIKKEFKGKIKAIIKNND